MYARGTGSQVILALVEAVRATNLPNVFVIRSRIVSLPSPAELASAHGRQDTSDFRHHPAYGRPLFLRELLESVCTDVESSLVEVIVTDDGSTEPIAPMFAHEFTSVLVRLEP